MDRKHVGYASWQALSNVQVCSSKIRRDTRANDYSMVLSGAAGGAETFIPRCGAAKTRNTDCLSKRPLMHRRIVVEVPPVECVRARAEFNISARFQMCL